MQSHESLFQNYKEIGNLIAEQGQDFVISMAILVVGLIAIKQLNSRLKPLLQRLRLRPAMASTVTNILCVVLLFVVIGFALESLGIVSVVVRRFLILISLSVIGIIAIFRPLMPTLPFKVGNTVRVGDLLGKVEATTLIHTRMKTFDGRTVFIPNSKILNDFVINYHFTETRRVSLDVGIRYDQDILKAKQILESIMIEDPRVKVKPRPAVYFVKMADSCIELGGRCWVDNVKWWVTKCDLQEKTKLRFDHEGITIAFPQLDVHHHQGNVSPEFAGGSENSCLRHSRVGGNPVPPRVDDSTGFPPTRE